MFTSRKRKRSLKMFFFVLLQKILSPRTSSIVHIIVFIRFFEISKNSQSIKKVTLSNVIII